MATKTILEAKVGQVTNELGITQKKDHKQAWTKAGNSTLFSKRKPDLKPELVEQLHNELRGYLPSTVRLKKPIAPLR